MALCLRESSRAAAQANQRYCEQRSLSTTPYKSLQHTTESEVTKSKAQIQGSSRLLQLAEKTQSQKRTPNTLKDPSFLSTISAACTLPNKMGIDICYIPRVAEILADEQKHSKFWSRVLNPLETALYKIPPHKKAGFLAGRWAAKEAIIKAWGAQEDEKKIFMQDIIILTPKLCRTVMVANGGTAGSFNVSREGQAPELKQDQERRLEGGKTVEDADKEDSESSVTESGPPRAFVRKPDSTGWKELSISISHDGDYAMAVALITLDATKTQCIT
jgi:phosphopantetheine--protein transferase-like protein